MSFTRIWLIGCLLCIVASEDSDQTSLKCEIENQNLKDYFESLLDVKWFHVANENDLIEALQEDNIIISIDVDYNKELIISKDYPLQKFLLKFAASTKKKGVKYNIKNLETFKQLVYTFKPGYLFKAELAAFPQLFHFNVEKTNDDSFITEVSAFYNENKDLINCYTISFGWGEDEECSGVTDDDVQSLISKAKKFADVKKNLMIDISNLPNGSNDLSAEFETFTFTMNENSKCSNLKTFSQDIEIIKGKYVDKLLMDATNSQYLYTHAKLCTENKPLIESLTNPNINYPAVTWKLITKMEELDKEIKEDIIKVDIKDSDPSKMFLGGNFKTFIDKFSEKQALKGLQINFINQKSFDAYWNIEYTTLKDLPKIRFGVSLEPKLNQQGVDFNYKRNGWLDCYTVLFSAEEGVGGYTEQSINRLVEQMEPIQAAGGKIITLNLKRAADPESKKAIDLLKTNGYTLQVTSEIDDVEMTDLRNFLRSQPGILLDADLKRLKDILKPVTITELLPQVAEDAKILNFTKIVQSKIELAEELKVEKSMIQVIVTNQADELEVGDGYTLKDCLEELRKTNKNGIKLRFEDTAALTKSLELGVLKYLNYPVWLEFDILRDDKLNWEEHTNELILLGHQLVLGWGNGDFSATEVIAKTESLKNKIDFIFTIKLKDIVEKSSEVTEILKSVSTNILITSLPLDDPVNTKTLREKLLDIPNYYVNVVDKLILEECPEAEMIISNKITMSDYISNEEELTKLIGNYDMLRIEIYNKNNKLFVDKKYKLTLDNFISLFEKLAANKSVGIIFTLSSEEIYRKVMIEVPKMKTLNNPIWFDLKLIDSSKATILNLDYKKYNDKLDCRTVVTGISIGDGFTEYSAELIERLKLATEGFSKEKIYAFDFNYAAKSREAIESTLDIENILIYSTDGLKTSTTADFRKSIKSLGTNVIFDFPGKTKYAALDCPGENNILNYFDEDFSTDLSKLMFSNFITNKDDISKAITDKVHMLNVNVKLKGTIPIAKGGIPLVELLQAVEELDEGVKVGVRLTFETTEAFETSASDPVILRMLRNINRPIWLSANVVGLNAVNLNHRTNNDLLDCRSLSLGWSGSASAKYSKANIQRMQALPLGSNEKMYIVDFTHIVKSFEDIKDILLMKPSETVIRRKPEVEVEKVPNGNKIMLALREEEIANIDFSEFDEILNANKDLFIYDMTYEIKTVLFGGGAALSLSLIVVLASAFILMMMR